MKSLFFVLVSFLLSFSSFGQSQGEMNNEANGNRLNADKELNISYKKILTKYKKDTVFIKNLKISQRIWIQFRDAEMNMKFPDYGKGYYGSVQPMCRAMYQENLIRDRIKTLKVWITGEKEGEVCNGSVNIKN